MNKILCFFFLSVYSFAQEKRPKIIKVNLSAAAMGTVTLQHEKAIGKHFSLAFGAGYRPKTLLPYAKKLEKYFNFADKEIEYISFDNVRKTEVKVEMYHITPELRFYFGHRQAPIGTYLSLFAKYNNFRSDIPVFVDLSYKDKPLRVELPVDTRVQTTTAGLMLGHQFYIGNHFTFDCYIIGFHFGSADVSGEAKQNLEGFDDDFRVRLRDKILTTFKINENYLGVELDESGIGINNVRRLNYMNLRGFGFNLGYQF